LLRQVGCIILCIVPIVLLQCLLANLAAGSPPLHRKQKLCKKNKPYHATIMPSKLSYIGIRDVIPKSCVWSFVLSSVSFCRSSTRHRTRVHIRIKNISVLWRPQECRAARGCQIARALHSTAPPGCCLSARHPPTRPPPAQPRCHLRKLNSCQ
jgi:hypothetical protein